MAKKQPDNEVAMADMFSAWSAEEALAEMPGNLLTPRQSRFRTMSGFSEIRIKSSAVEADYVISNGKVTSEGTFRIAYGPNDPTDQMVQTINKLLTDAFVKFEKISAD
jgi:hypothetical protein